MKPAWLYTAAGNTAGALLNHFSLRADHCCFSSADRARASARQGEPRNRVDSSASSQSRGLSVLACRTWGRGEGGTGGQGVGGIACLQARAQGGGGGGDRGPGGWGGSACWLASQGHRGGGGGGQRGGGAQRARLQVMARAGGRGGPRGSDSITIKVPPRIHEKDKDGWGAGLKKPYAL